MTTNTDLGLFSDWDRPEWDECFMGLAAMLSTMSPDPSTKIGSIIVDEYNHVKAMGFNGFPPDCDDELMPKTRPDKYDVIEHAEANAINNRSISVRGMRLYVTCMPCLRCFKTILHNGITEVMYDPTESAACVTDHDHKIISLMNKSKKTGKDKCIIKPFEGDIEKCFHRYLEYRRIKFGKG